MSAPQPHPLGQQCPAEQHRRQPLPHQVRHRRSDQPEPRQPGPAVYQQRAQQRRHREARNHVPQRPAQCPARRASIRCRPARSESPGRPGWRSAARAARRRRFRRRPAIAEVTGTAASCDDDDDSSPSPSASHVACTPSPTAAGRSPAPKCRADRAVVPYDRNVPCEDTSPGPDRRSPARPARARRAGPPRRCRIADTAVRRPAHPGRAGPVRRCSCWSAGRDCPGRRVSQERAQRPDHVVQRAGHRVTGSETVSAATEGRRNRGQVESLGAHGDRPVQRLDLFEHRRDFGLSGGAHNIDDALDLFGPRLGPLVVQHHGIDQTAAVDRIGQQLCRGQHPRQHRQPGERVGVQERAADTGVVDAQLDEPGRQPVRAGGCPSERPRVGCQPGVEAMCNGQVERLTQASSRSATSMVVESAFTST